VNICSRDFKLGFLRGLKLWLFSSSFMLERNALRSVQFEISLVAKCEYFALNLMSPCSSFIFGLETSVIY